MVAFSSPEAAEIIVTLGPEVVITESPDRILTLKSLERDKEFVVRLLKKVKTVDLTILAVCGAHVYSGRDVTELVKLGTEDIRASRAIFEEIDPVGMLTEMVKALENDWRAQRQYHAQKLN